jgi:hypothetical protein
MEQEKKRKDIVKEIKEMWFRIKPYEYRLQNPIDSILKEGSQDQVRAVLPKICETAKNLLFSTVIEQKTVFYDYKMPSIFWLNDMGYKTYQESIDERAYGSGRWSGSHIFLLEPYVPFAMQRKSFSLGGSCDIWGCEDEWYYGFYDRCSSTKTIYPFDFDVAVIDAYNLRV